MDDLMQIGELPGPDETFPAWEPIDVAMDRLHERFVGHYHEPTSWDYSIWLGLTEAGRRVAEEVRGGHRPPAAKTPNGEWLRRPLQRTQRSRALSVE
jgi:hypothetical protein